MSISKNLVAIFGLAPRSPEFVIVALLVGFLGFRVLTNETGMCWQAGRIYTPDESMRLAVEKLIKEATVYRVEREGIQGGTNSTNVRENLVKTELVAFENYDDFFKTHGSCCQLDPHDDFGPFTPGWTDYLLGWTHGVMIGWGETRFTRNGILYRVNFPAGDVRLISNCGQSKRTFWINW